MYNATLGILWSVCTSTFIPFFNVRAETGYSACPRTPPAESKVAHKNPAHNPPNPNLFMNPPCQRANVRARFSASQRANRAGPFHHTSQPKIPRVVVPSFFRFVVLSFRRYIVTSLFPSLSAQTPSPAPQIHLPI